ncbi:hypothetical protein VST7929_03073 [Vibrio stylophorae]|uniref:Cyclic nucleotide-binding domain-containing protein n=1 Tax=Vibrio stylophorae TaxID=659351 RepID=A0ABN8DYS3_9VIBR|nr:Crp/Fnr family transcriptional regulator [Vibrio stylophorae]CAH0535503.1 hypothetical protein VST7929_03073 [Vibrio stylophorae]
MQIKPYPHLRFGQKMAELQLQFEQQLKSLVHHSHDCIAGEILLEQGQTVEQLLIVSVGRVSMSTTANNGRRFQLGEVQCDDQIFGEIEFFTHEPCQWWVVAEDPLTVDFISFHALEKWLEVNPQFLIFFSGGLAFDYQDSLAISTQRLLHSIRYNIAQDLWLRQHQAQMPFVLGGFDKAEQEAERFGTSSRVYRRAVKSLIEEGWVMKTEQGLEIIDDAGLQAYLSEIEAES